MKALVWKEFIIVIGVVLVMIAGCVQQEPMSVKMSRLVAAENMELKEELRQQDWEINSLKELHEQQVKKLEDIITEYKGQVKSWQEKSRQNIREQVKTVLDVVLERNAELREENKALKEDNEKLKKELQGAEQKSRVTR